MQVGVQIFTHIIIATAVLLTYLAIFKYPLSSDFTSSISYYAFQWHPVLEITGFVGFMYEGILMFKIVHWDHEVAKAIHLTFHFFGLACSIIGVIFIFKFHNDNNIDNLYSAHGIIGLVSVVLFGVQWLVGFFTFVFPKLNDFFRKLVLPYHRVLGTVVMVMSLCAIGMGYEDRQRIVSGEPDHGEWGSASRMENAAIFFIGTSVACVLFALSPAANNPILSFAAKQTDGDVHSDIYRNLK